MRAEAEAELENFQKEIEKEKEEHKLSSMSDSEMAEYMKKLKEREEEKRQVITCQSLLYFYIHFDIFSFRIQIAIISPHVAPMAFPIDPREEVYVSFP